MSKLYDLTRPLGEPASANPAVLAAPTSATLAGFTFLGCLERSPLGEIWKVRGPDQRIRVAYYLRVGDGAGLDGRLERLPLFSHPAMPGIEIVEADPGRTVLLGDGLDWTLQERFDEVWSNGHAGMPRPELLGYLRTAAEALDAVHQASGFQHLALNPRTLWLDQGQLRVGGFGLVALLWLPTGRPVTELNARYSAPELFRGHISRCCDQYSLALIFAELLTGVHPREETAGRRRQGARTSDLDLALLCSADQEVIARALRYRPSQRFASCVALVQALQDAPVAPLVDYSRLPASLPPIIPASADDPVVLPAAATTLHHFIMELVALAAGPAQLTASETIRFRLEPGRSLEHRCAVQSFPGAIALRLEGFRQRWHAERTEVEPGRFGFAVHFPPDFWQRLTGQRLGLEIQIDLVAAQRLGCRPTEVAVTIRPFGCNRVQAAKLLAETGPVLLQSIREYVQAQPEQRGQDRLTIDQPLRVRPVLADLQLAEPIECVGKDISTRGIGFFLPHPPSSSQVYINLPDVPQMASLAGLAQIVRGEPCGDGWYEVGASFAGDGPKEY